MLTPPVCPHRFPLNRLLCRSELIIFINDCVPDKFIIILFSQGLHAGSWTNPQPTLAFCKALAAGTTGDDWRRIPVGNTPQLLSHVFSHRPLCFDMNASVRKNGLRAGKKTQNMTVCRASQKEVLRNVCFADVQRAFRHLHYLTSQVKLDYGSCSVSYIRRWKILQLQRLKSPDGTKHAFVKIHLHYTDFIFPPSSQSHSALAFWWLASDHDRKPLTEIQIQQARCYVLRKGHEMTFRELWWSKIGYQVKIGDAEIKWLSVVRRKSHFRPNFASFSGTQW